MQDSALEGVCTALAGVLHERTGRLVIRDRPIERGDVGLVVRLQITRFEKSVMTGHLEWSDGPAAPEDFVQGPEMTMTVQDREMFEGVYPEFASNLIKITDLPLR